MREKLLGAIATPGTSVMTGAYELWTSVMTGTHELWTPPHVAHMGGYLTCRLHFLDYCMRTNSFKLWRHLRGHGNHAVRALRDWSAALSAK